MFYILIILIIMFLWKFKEYKIDFESLFKKGLKPINDVFGVIFVTGKQGSGKSYIAIKLLLSQDKNLFKKIKTNMKSLNVPGFEIEYFDKITDIYFDDDKFTIYVLDELSRKYDKNSRTDKQFFAWLNQSRKNNRLVIMITQEWKELPMWIRRPARFMITTYQNYFLRLFKLYISVIGDAENMILDKDELEWTCPPLQYIVYKRNQYIADMYDTLEVVNEL